MSLIRIFALSLGRSNPTRERGCQASFSSAGNQAFHSLLVVNLIACVWPLARAMQKQLDSIACAVLNPILIHGHRRAAQIAWSHRKIQPDALNKLWSFPG